ncbi:hypothetical protein F4861DRAFT_545625 [Xylaria intraflava]|nr:hypothetical protein F4861DRAFT_545625 [Xylaria intraflava]
MSGKEPEKGDKVSWNWGGGAPGGTVAETKHEGELAIESKRGNTIKKNASHDNPAVRVERSGNDVVKRASELTVEVKAKAPEKQKAADDDTSNGKRKAKTQEDQESGDEYKEDGENGTEDESDLGDPHVVNKEGKEVKRGGKDANKKQKKNHSGDATGKTNVSKNADNLAGKHKTEATERMASRDEQDVVSTRTRAHEKVTSEDS